LFGDLWQAGHGAARRGKAWLDKAGVAWQGWAGKVYQPEVLQ